MRHLFRRSSLLLALAASRAIAGQVTHDGSLGPSKTLQGPNYTILPTDGRQVGGNLFHSFSKLNLTAGERANFTGPSSVRNVLARVTDGTASQIDGALQCSIPGANLFFMNPAGIVFGPNSSLDIDGAFVATTADVIKLADGGRFAGDSIANNSVLTSADPSAFGFLKPKPAAIVLAGDPSSNTKATLRVTNGKTLSIIGGDITATSADAAAPGGRLNVISVGSSGELTGDVVSTDAAPVAVDSFGALGSVRLSSFSQLSVSGDPSGIAVIRGDSMRLDSFSSIFATTTDFDGPPIGIDIVLRDRLDLNQGTNIVTDSAGAGNGSGLRLFARTARIASVADDLLSSAIGTSATGSGAGGSLELHIRRLDIRGTASITSGVRGSGPGGVIIIHARDVSLSDGGSITSATVDTGTGQGGALSLHADSLAVNSGAVIRVNSGFSGALSGSIDISLTGTLRMSGENSTIDGDGRLDAQSRGAIVITADQVMLDDGSVISGTTILSGTGGALVLTARTIDIRGGASVRSSTFGGADAGLISLTADEQLTLDSGGSIFTSALGSGSGGSILAAAGSIVMDSESTISSNTGGEIQGIISDGPGGNILVTADTVTLRGGSVISSATIGAGDAGAVALIAAGNVTFSGSGSGINSPTIPLSTGTTSGQGGTIGVFTPMTLLIDNGASIRAVSASSGAAGAITVNAGELIVRGADAQGNPSAISSRARGEFVGAGPGGTIDLTAQHMIVGEGAIVTSASIGPSDSGNVTIRAGDLSLQSNGLIATSADIGNGGVLSINADNVIALSHDARITAAASGTGGNISLAAAGKIDVNDSTITAAAGNQGNISIRGNRSVVVRNSTITAQAQGTGGAISIGPRLVVLDNSTINGLAGGADVLVTITSDLLNSTNSQILTDRGFFTIDTDLAQSLAGFDLNLPDAGARLQASCEVRAFGEVSSFTTVGAGGISLDPAKPAPATGP